MKKIAICILSFIVLVGVTDYLLREIDFIKCAKGGNIRQVDGEWKTFTNDELFNACRGIDIK
jgi:hypothetical protein